MAEPSWIGIGGFIASACSALAAYLAIRQTINQRKTSIKPQLILNNFEIKLNKLSKNNYTARPFEEVDNSELGPAIINAGLGSALNIKIEWSYPQLEKLNWLKENLNKINNAFSITISSSHGIDKSHFNISGGGYTVIWTQENIHSMNYILPLNITKKPVIANMPLLILNTMLNETNFLALINGILDKDVQGPSLKMTYYDVEGTKFSIKYNSKLIVKEISPHLYHNNYSGTVLFDVVDQSMTRQVLQRIRKSYARFIKENN